MDPDRARRVEDIFESLLERDPETRTQTLLDLCGDDPALQRDVRKLLAAHARPEGVLEKPFGVDRGLGGEEDDGILDQLVGRYRVLEEIGRGGMGRVYLAERADGQFQQTVALKVIKNADSKVRARVVAERQILASLEHPNIGRLLDGGVTEDDRPFLVMELVDGLPIDLFCDGKQLSIRDRLKLFLTVLRAVGHAHHSLVVHRDLKPSNILVTAAGEVKLLDFGIAKILAPDQTLEDGPVTKAQDRALTPEYASPEQIKGEPIRTAADIYSLGVILYQLLSGFRPYGVTQGSLPDLVKTVCEDDPSPPSNRLTAPAALSRNESEGETSDPLEVARERQTTTARLERDLRGDLDAIVMRCLRKEPGDRYGSVELLAQDIEDFLSGRPVEARRGNRWYRVRKLTKRHWGGALAAALVTTSLLGGATLAGWQAREAARERDRARAAQRESEEVSEFLLGLFRSSDPTESLGEPVTALDLLDRGAAMAGELREEPLVQARMLQVMARANENLGRYAESEVLAGRSVELLRAEFGSQHEEVAFALLHLGSALRRGGRYDSARVVLGMAAGIQERVFGGDALVLSGTLHAQAGIDVYLGDLEVAEERARAALALRERHLGANATGTLDVLRTLSSILRSRGLYLEAEAGFREVLRRRRSSALPNPLDLSADLLQVGDMVAAQGGDLGEAERLIREALLIQEPGAGKPMTNRAWALTSLAGLMFTKGDIPQAESLLREAFAERRRTYGDLHPLVSESLGELGLFFSRTGRLEEAEELLRQAVEINLATVGPLHTRHAGTLTGLARILMLRGELTEADSFAAEALTIRRKAQGSGASVIAETLAILAEVRIQRERYEDAESLLLQALDIISDLPEGALLHRRIHGDLADLYSELGREDDATRHRAFSPVGG